MERVYHYERFKYLRVLDTAVRSPFRVIMDSESGWLSISR
jgi:hypothetical protein